jgi:outer membrane immunogenic protein
MGSIRGRIGITPWQQMLIYGTGGYAWGDIDYATSDIDGGALDPTESSSGSVSSGWVAGGGAELSISRGTTARIEYLHYDFDRATTVTPSGDRFAFDTELDVVRFGLSYRLGSGESPFESLMAGSIGSLKDGGEMPADWTGFYAGAHLGSVDASGTHTDVDGDQDLVGTTHELTGFGYAAGIHAGYNQDLGMIVLGVEADWSLADLETSAILDNTPASGGDRDGLAITTIDSLASIRGRIGINPWERMHVFATGGIAWADIDNRIEDTVAGTGVPDPANSGSVSSDSGWVAGAGLEVMLTSRLSSKTDYLHYDFGETSLVTPSGFEHRFSNEIDVVRTGLSYRF